MASLYETAIKTLPPEHIDHHESDLYILKTPESTAIVKAYEFSTIVEQFRSQIDGLIWYDIPFGYTPYWEAIHNSGRCANTPKILHDKWTEEA